MVLDWDMTTCLHDRALSCIWWQSKLCLQICWSVPETMKCCSLQKQTCFFYLKLTGIHFEFQICPLSRDFSWTLKSFKDIVNCTGLKIQSLSSFSSGNNILHSKKLQQLVYALAAALLQVDTSVRNPSSESQPRLKHKEAQSCFCVFLCPLSLGCTKSNILMTFPHNKRFYHTK